MKVISWNINGLRSLKDGLDSILKKLDADIVCFQETKITRDMLEESMAVVDGYHSFFSFSKNRSGYSGVATFCRTSITPTESQEGLSGTFGKVTLEGGEKEALQESWPECDLKALDAEGRCIITQHLLKNGDAEILPLTIINVYCPRVDPEKPERQEFKLKFYELLRQRAAAFAETGSSVIILGDINTSHKRIDHCEPDEQDFEERLDRQFLDNFITPISEENLNESLANEVNSSRQDYCVVDSFRYFHPAEKNAFTCWNTKSNARSTNYGTRIDYVLCSADVISLLSDSFILSDVEGSDHCPVGVIFKNVSPIASHKVPDSCTKFYSEFQGKQKNLRDYLNATVCATKRKCDTKGEPSSKQMKLNAFFKPRVAKVENIVNISQTEIIQTIDIKPRELKPEWGVLMKGPKAVPLCSGHQEPSVLRTVRKKGANFNRQFYACSRGAGRKEDTNAQCNFFQWC